MFSDTKTIDKTVPVPLYYQLKELILEAISEKKYTPGDVIPTENDISNYYQISRTTVRQAIGELVQEGILYRIKSKGTFVSEPKISQEYISKIMSFNDEILQRGMKPSTEVLQLRVLQWEEIPTEVFENFHLEKGEQIIFLHRKRMADGKPIVHSKTFLPFTQCKEVFQHDLNKERLYSILDLSEETRIHHLDRTIEATEATSEDAKLLEMERKKPIQYIRSVGYNSSGQVIEYTLSRYRGDRNQFTVTVFHEVEK